MTDDTQIAEQEKRQQQDRIQNLLSYCILDTLPEEDYDAITQIAAEICQTPIALISFVDDHRQWFKSRHGLKVLETNKDIAFCAHAIETPAQPMIVPDARLDFRFKDNPLVVGEPSIVFYAGFPLKSSEGHALGTLCIIDTKVKALSNSQINAMRALSKQIIRLLDLRKKQKLLEQKSTALAQANFELNQFAKLAADDIKGPLANICMTTNKLVEDVKRGVNSNSLMYVKMISKSSNRLCGLIDALLLYYSSEGQEKKHKKHVTLSKLISQLKETLCLDNQVTIELNSTLNDVLVNEMVLKQVLLNLLSNAIKYNRSEHIMVAIAVSPITGGTEFHIKDNGIGIPADCVESIFQIFTAHETHDRFGNQGTGIGLAAVKKLVESQGGVIAINSEVGVGTEITFTLK